MVVEYSLAGGGGGVVGLILSVCTSFPVVQVPFDWHHAPGLVQHLVASATAKVSTGTVVVVLYLNDILFLGRGKQEVAHVTGRSEQGYHISLKSQAEPVEDVTWIGIDVSAAAGRIASRPTAIADCFTRWVRLATKLCTRNAVRRVPGRLVWLGRPGNTASPLRAGMRVWVHKGPNWAPRTPPALVA